MLYVASAVVTFAATYVYATSGKEGAYWCLYIGAWLFSLANGKTVEGFVVRESGDDVELRTSAGISMILKKEDIDERARR